MHDIPKRIADILLEVEATLRRSGRWERARPPESALGSQQPFCLDTLRFEQWLQWIFLPRMKQIVEQQKPLPTRSGILAYAQASLPGKDPACHDLINIISRFDQLIAIQAGGRPH